MAGPLLTTMALALAAHALAAGESAGLVAEAPSISADKVVIAPGQTVLARLTPAGLVPADPAALEERNSRYFGDVLRFTMAFDPAKEHTTLVVNNGYGQFIKYRAEMVVSDRPSPLHTSICPMIAHGSGHELWPHSIVRLELHGFRFLGEQVPSRFVCD